MTSASAAPIDADIAPKTVRADRYPEHWTPFADGVAGLPNVVYSTLRGYRPLQLDIYRRNEPSIGQALPLVVWIHGGGWSRGDSRTNAAFANFPSVLASLAARGYVVASVNYRLSAEARFPAAIQDVKAAIRFLRANASRFGIDPARVLVWGGSAGGQLAALVAASCGVAALEPPVLAHPSGEPLTYNPDPAILDSVQGAVTWYGVFDLQSFASSQTTVSPAVLSNYLGCDPKECPEVVASASPVTYVDHRTPPMLLIHGTQDTEVSVTQADIMEARLQSAQVPVTKLLIPGVDHGFIGPDLQTTRAASLLALRCTFEFIDATLAR
jgi:acetyl esterase/lipase